MRMLSGVVISLLAVLAAGPSSAVTVPLFEVDFDGDPNGLPPVATTPFDFDATPFPRSRVSRIIFGTPFVTPGPTPLARALGFQGGDPYEQISLDLRYGLLDPTLRGYQIRFDLIVADLTPSPFGDAGSFTILLDAPAANSLSFRGDGTLETYQPFGPLGEEYDSVGSYADDTVYQVEMTVDLEGYTWAATVNGQLLFTKTLPALDLQSVRFNLAMNEPTDLVYLDNLAVWAVVPEPATRWLAAAMLTWLALRPGQTRRAP